MSLEAISTIKDAEDRARAMKQESAAEAKRAIADACRQGDEVFAAAVKKAEDEIREMMAEADEQAKKSAAEMAGQNENKKAAMRARAEVKLEKSAELIVERIVNS